jgi:hypothetical protein
MATQGVEGPTAEGPTLLVAAREAIKPSDSSLESSINPFSGALDSTPWGQGGDPHGACNDLFLLLLYDHGLPLRERRGWDGVKAAGDTEGDEGGKASADCLGEPPSSRQGILRR